MACSVVYGTSSFQVFWISSFQIFETSSFQLMEHLVPRLQYILVQIWGILAGAKSYIRVTLWLCNHLPVIIEIPLILKHRFSSPGYNNEIHLFLLIQVLSIITFVHKPDCLKSFFSSLKPESCELFSSLGIHCHKSIVLSIFKNLGL